jgi:hypothetical protein
MLYFPELNATASAARTSAISPRLVPFWGFFEGMPACVLGMPTKANHNNGFQESGPSGSSVSRKALTSCDPIFLNVMRVSIPFTTPEAAVYVTSMPRVLDIRVRRRLDAMINGALDYFSNQIEYAQDLVYKFGT